MSYLPALTQHQPAPQVRNLPLLFASNSWSPSLPDLCSAMSLHPKGLGNCSSTPLFSELLSWPPNASPYLQSGPLQIIFAHFCQSHLSNMLLIKQSPYSKVIYWPSNTHRIKFKPSWVEHKALHSVDPTFLASSFALQPLLYKHEATSCSGYTEHSALPRPCALYLQVSLPGMSTPPFTRWWISIQFF